MGKLAIGVDIGGTRTKFGLVHLETGKVLARKITATETQDEAAFLAAIETTLAGFAIVASKIQQEIAGIGIGVPGFVFDDGMVDSTYGFLEFMEDYPMQSIIEKRLDMPCKLDNDARVVALGEALFGAGKDYGRVLVLTLGTGLGVGFTISGVLPETLPYAHMAGHIRIADTGGNCYCGKSGCLEAFVSATGLCSAAGKLTWQNNGMPAPLTAESIFEARTNGDATATYLIEDYKRHLATGISNYVNIYAPDMIVLGGGMASGLVNDLPALQPPRVIGPYKAYQATLSISELGEDAGILGSAALFNDTINQSIKK